MEVASGQIAQIVRNVGAQRSDVELSIGGGAVLCSSGCWMGQTGCFPLYTVRGDCRSPLPDYHS